MAHFAELDSDNNVIRTIVISNNDILDENGVEQESLGLVICASVAGPGTWKQTSFNNNFRGIFGQPGKKYAPDKDVFYDPVGPFPSWVLDSEYHWQPPIPKPPNASTDCYWDEKTISWIEPYDLPT